MNNQLTLHAQLPGLLTKSTGDVRTFQVGQILNAVALTDSKQGQAILRIGRLEVSAKTSMPVQQGARFMLEVTQLHPQPVLKIVSPSPQSTANIPDTLRLAMEQFLPKQRGLLPLLTQLSILHQNLHNTGIPFVAHSLANKLLNGLSARHQIVQPEGLRSAMQQSGLFMEARLAASINDTPTEITGDLKAQLLRLLSALPPGELKPGAFSTRCTNTSATRMNSDPPPPFRGNAPVPQSSTNLSSSATTATLPLPNFGLREQTEGALARLILHQITTLENINDAKMMWQLEIPIRQGEQMEMIPLRVEREPVDSKDDGSNAWAIALALDLPSLGSIEMRLGYRNNCFSSTFWSETQDTVSIVTSELGQLRSNLIDHGLEVNILACRSGKPPHTSSVSPGPTIIDIQA